MNYYFLYFGRDLPVASQSVPVVHDCLFIKGSAFNRDNMIYTAGADPGFFAGGGQRRPCTAGAFGVRADGGSRVDKHQIKVHSVHRIFRAIFFDFFFLAS